MSIVDRIRRIRHRAEVWRWRFSKRIGVPGLERISWGCILANLVWMASGVQSLLIAVGMLRRPEQALADGGATLVYFIIMLVVSAVVAYAMRPNIDTSATAATPQRPVVEDGKGLIEIFGTVWVDDANQIGWRNRPPVPIRRSGGK